MKNIKIIILGLIIILAIFLRFWQIDKYPAGFNADEASYAYNAYSLIETGKDEFGNSWPVYFVSFGDYKPGGTTYFMLPFVKLFGLNETAARLPSLMAGVFSVFLIYLFVQELFGVITISLLSALFLAISPWHIHFSRGAWETNIATTFLLLGTYLFLKGLKNSKFFVFSVIAYSISIYTYHTPRIVIPLLGLFLVSIYRKQLIKNLKWVMISGVVGFLILLPFLLSSFSPAVTARFSGVGVFADTGPIWQVNFQRGEHSNPNSIISKLFHNKLISYGLRIGQNYLSHFDGIFLFVLGDRINRSNPPDMGEMYLFDAIFVLMGIYFLFKNRPKYGKIVLAWLLIAPLASSMTFQSPTALRAHNMIIPLIIISAYGCYYLSLLIKEKFPKILHITYYILLIAFMVWNISYYLHQYYVHYPKAYPEAWEYGLKDLVRYLEPIKSKYDKIYVTEKYDQPYIIFLFYLHYSPNSFQKEAILTQRDKFGFSTVRDFDKYHFELIDWEKLKREKNILVCGTSVEIPETAKVIKTINFLNNEPALKCAEI